MIEMISLLIILSILAGISYYLAYRMYQGLACFFQKIRFWPVLVIVFSLVLLLILGFVQAYLPASASIRIAIGTAGSYCMGILFYLLLFTIAADLLMFFSKLMKRSFVTYRRFRGYVILCVIILTCITCVYGFANVRQIHHVSYDIQLESKEDVSDLHIVMISDLHLGAIGSESRLKDIVSEINALKPDVVCIAGDFFDTDFSSIQDPDASVKTLQALQATYGTYACLGNHDGGKTNGQMVEFLQRANIQVLRDEYVVIDERLILLGRLDAFAIGGYGEQERKPLSAVFTRENPSLPVVVLDHNPANIDEYTTEADLLLCGHTHKGQLFPINIITDLIYTVDYGYYQKDKNRPHVIVTSGVGTWGMPMRVGSNCEIVSIRFTGDR